jgi:hypothetical protein
MRNGMSFIVLSMLMLLVGFTQGIAAEKASRSTLEQVWNSHLKTCESGKESELQKTMSSFRFGSMKNNLAQANRTLTPDLIKSIAGDAPRIATAKFVKLIENGPTAGLVYVKDSEERDASNKPLVSFMFIKFVKENEAWKVDGVMSMDGPKFEKDGKESAFNLSDLPPTYEIDGKIRKSPEQAAAPDISGSLDVFSYGYKTEVTINEDEQKTTVNKSYSGLIKGGLRKGKNTIVIGFTKLDGKAAPTPGVTVQRFFDDRDAKEVFKYEPKDNIEGTHTLTFTVEK